jgi:hypothetical protein
MVCGEFRDVLVLHYCDDEVTGYKRRIWEATDSERIPKQVLVAASFSYVRC